MGSSLINLLETFVFGVTILFFVGFLLYGITLFFITKINSF